jgi:tetratricopeptide (TPR) repeat protein
MTTTLPVKEAEVLLKKGIRMLETNNLEQAATLFETAFGMEQKNGCEPSPRVMSYCGYTMAFARKKYNDGLRMCRAAVEKEFFNPDLFFNLGDIYLARGDKKNAHVAFNRGLSLAPNHHKIRARIKEMGVRKRAVIPFLDREHFLNRFLGALLRESD